MRMFRCGALALALAMVPACAPSPLGRSAAPAPQSPAPSLEIRAYALAETYAAALDAAAILVADPQTPAARVDALARAEAAATPAARAILTALSAHQQARRGSELGGPSPAATLLTEAQIRSEAQLAAALARAEGPIRQFAALAGY